MPSSRFQSLFLFRALWLVLTLAVMLSVKSSDVGAADTLHPSFADETKRDPFLTPARAQTFGPLSDENLDRSWNGQGLDSEAYSSAEPDEVFIEPDPESEPGSTVIPPGSRRPVIDIGLTTTWLAPVDDFGIMDVEAKASLIIPVFVKGSPLRLAFNLGTSFIDAPDFINAPDQLYSLQSELRWFIPWREGLGFDFALGAGLFSDLNGGLRGLRATGRALVMKELTPTIKLSAGILYLGRKNLVAIPVAGAIYTPQPDWKVELLVPRARAMKRLALNGTREHWVYAGTELFGGNSWAIERADGTEDDFIYKDHRLIVGYETKSPGALAGRVEAGYVFARRVEFTNDPTEYDPSGTVLFRAGLTY